MELVAQFCPFLAANIYFSTKMNCHSRGVRPRPLTQYSLLSALKLHKMLLHFAFSPFNPPP